VFLAPPNRARPSEGDCSSTKAAEHLCAGSPLRVPEGATGNMGDTLSGHMGDSAAAISTRPTWERRGSGGAAIEERSDAMQVRPNRAGGRGEAPLL
jgi:hypothetical protein